jgi:hypothetical protein
VKQIQYEVRVARRLGKESRDGGVPIKVINQTKGEIVVDNKQHLGSVAPLHFSESAVKTVPGLSPCVNWIISQDRRDASNGIEVEYGRNAWDERWLLLSNSGLHRRQNLIWEPTATTTNPPGPEDSRHET